LCEAAFGRWRGERFAWTAEHGAAIRVGGADDGAKGGVGFGTPSGAEPVGHLAEDHAGPERPFGDVVGGWDAAVGNEYEQVRAVLGDAATQALGRFAVAG